MSTIEERLARDIAEATGRVVVTESDLREGRRAVDERIDSRRQRDRRRVWAAAAAAAVVIPVLGAAALQTFDTEESAPPAGSGPASPNTDDASEGAAPTAEQLAGLWRVDNGTTLVRFSPPDQFALDTEGRLFSAPEIQGTYTLSDDLVTVTVEDADPGCAGERIALRATLTEPGSMRLLNSEVGPGECSFEQHGQWVMEQVLPTRSRFMRDLTSPDDADWQPLAGQASLYGVWFAVGGGHLLEIDPGGTYHVADASGEPVDIGQWSYRGPDFTLTSSAASTVCNEGDRQGWRGVEQARVGTTFMRTTMAKEDCATGLASKVWLWIPQQPD